MDTVTIQGFVATTHPVDKYGRVALSREVIEGIAEAYRQGAVPLTFNHDGRHLLRQRVISVDVRETEEGHYGVFVVFEMDREAWDALGEPQGFSVSVFADSRVFESMKPDAPTIFIAADPKHFGGTYFTAAVSLLREDFRVESAYLLQFSTTEPATVIITIAMATLHSIPPNLISSALWDALKACFLKPRESDVTDFRFEVTNTQGERTVRAFVRTNSETVRTYAEARHLVG